MDHPSSSPWEPPTSRECVHKERERRDPTHTRTRTRTDTKRDTRVVLRGASRTRAQGWTRSHTHTRRRRVQTCRSQTTRTEDGRDSGVPVSYIEDARRGRRKRVSRGPRSRVPIPKRTPTSPRKSRGPGRSRETRDKGSRIRRLGPGNPLHWSSKPRPSRTTPFPDLGTVQTPVPIYGPSPPTSRGPYRGLGWRQIRHLTLDIYWKS